MSSLYPASLAQFAVAMAQGRQELRLWLAFRTFFAG
jgi:hypothetical protein